MLAVAIQLNDHAKKAESPILQYQAHELDYKSPHNSKFIIVSIIKFFVAHSLVEDVRICLR